MILALESSGPVGSIAVVNGADIVREKTFDCPRGRGGELFGVLEEILGEGHALTHVAVGLGPGSYNGIRAAIAAGWGVATARRIPLVGLSSLLALAEGEYGAVGDARRGQYYFARVKDGAFLQAPSLFEAKELLEAVRDISPIYVPASLDLLPQAVVTHASASRLGRLAVSVEPQETMPEPLYLKAAHITTPRVL